MTEVVTTDRIMETALGFMASKVLLSAVEIGLFSELAKAPADGATIARKLNLHQRSATDFLDTLVTMKLLERTGGIYRNTAETDRFLDREKPDYLGGIIEMANNRLYGFWGSLTDALRTGLKQNGTKSDPEIFHKLYEDPERLKGFLKAMTGLSKQSGRAIAEKFDWRPYQTFTDVGAAEGAVPVQVVLAHGHLAGGGFDLPQVQPIFEQYIREHGLADRVKFTGGDMFKDKWPKADVIIMGHILHDWGMERKQLLLAKAYDALPKGGALIVHDAMIDDDRSKNLGGLLMSLNMLIETDDGFDYTPSQCKQWMRQTGFKETRVEHLASVDWMVVAIK
jgi:precorrin-6B methylase 2